MLSLRRIPKPIGCDGQRPRQTSHFAGIFARRCTFVRASVSDGCAISRYRRGEAVLAVLCATIFALGLSAPSAFAGLAHQFKFQITGTPEGPFSTELRDITVDPASQRIYVTELGGGVDIFDDAGVYQARITATSIPTGQQFRPVSVAVSDKTGDVYVASFEEAGDRVYVFNALGVYLTTITGSSTPAKSFSSLRAVAVDQSSGDVYVADGTLHTVVDRFNSANEYESQLTFSAEPEGVATDASGDVYVTESEGGIYEFDSAGTQIRHIIDTPPKGTVAIDSEGNVYMAAGGAVDEFDLSGALVNETHMFVSASSALNGSFGELGGVALNAAGDMYVSDRTQRVIDVFGPSALIPGVSVEAVTGLSDSGANLHGVISPEGTEVSSCKFEYRTAAEPEFGSHSMQCSPSAPYTGIADVSVEAQLSGLAANTTYYYRLVASNAKGAEGGLGYGSEESFITPGAPRLGDVSAEVPPTEKVGQTSATLKAQVDPDSRETTYAFEYGETISYGTSIPIPAAAIGSGEALVAATAEVSGLKIGTTYHYRVSANNEFGTIVSADRTFSTLPPVLVENESVSDVASTSAMLAAVIDPLGSSAICEFQYVSEASFHTSGYAAAVSVPCPTGLGEGEVGVPTSVQVLGVTANTTYHYRVLAINGLGSVEGADHAFTTQSTGETASLPDGRRWEMVSRPNKQGALLEGLSNASALQASANGGAISYYAVGASESQPQGQAEGAQILSMRGPVGWSSQDIATPHNAAVGSPTIARGAGEYYLFSEDLGRALVEPHDPLKPFSPLTACTASGCASESFPAATEFTPYVRHDGTCASEVASCYEPLLTGATGYSDVAPGVEFGEPFAHNIHEEFVGAAPDLDSVVLASTRGLTPGAPQQKELYEWSAGAPATQRLRLASVLPASEGGGAAVGPNVNLGSYSEPTAGGWRPVSADGSRVFWTLGGEGSSHLYMRDMVKSETISIGAGVFQAASSDGSIVFFKDSEGGLSVCEIIEQMGKDTCAMTDLTSGGSGEQPGLLGPMIPGTSDDGTYAYFVAQGVLAKNENGNGDKAMPGGDNLYMLHRVGSEWLTTFIAQLSSTDQNDWGVAAQSFMTVGTLTARVSPNGRWLAFMSARALTGYDNSDAVTGRPDEEVYLYNAPTDKLVCASCNPSGARPVGLEVGQVANGGAGNGNVADIQEGNGGGGYGAETGIAANLPGGVRIENYQRGLYQPRYLSDSGRLFFNSSDSLASRDVNGQEDVYEYEPLGIKNSEEEELCTENSPTFGQRAEGCVDLISSGTSAGESGFMDANESGSDVFFLTSAKLVSSDFDSALDVYDAHECSSPAPCFPEVAASPPPCITAEACRAAPSPQPSIFGSPASATFSGVGNVESSSATSLPKSKEPTQTRAQKLKRALAACRNKPRRPQRSCRARARARYGVPSKPKNAGKSSRRSK